MARVNIQVDLKESDFLEKEVINEAKGIARRVARETMSEELQKEIDRIVDTKLTDAKKGEYYSSIIGSVTQVVSRRISNDIKLDTKDIDEIITAKVEEYLNNRMRSYGGIERLIQEYINKSIAEALTKK